VNFRLSILIFTLILIVICFLGCKKKTEPAKPEDKPAKPNITQQIDNNFISPNVPAKTETRQIVTTVNGLNIYKDDFDKRVNQEITPANKQMPANFFEQV